MSTDLLSCPFCGSKAELVSEHVSWQVRCTGGQQCATWPVTRWRDKNIVVAAWNRRFVCLDKNGDKVFAGDEVKLHGTSVGRVVMYELEWVIDTGVFVPFLPKEIELVKEKK